MGVVIGLALEKGILCHHLWKSSRRAVEFRCI